MTQSILLVDDAPDIHDVVAVRLRREKLMLHHAYDARSGLAMAQANPPDLILLDLDMPDIDGMELCRQLKEEPQLVQVPVIFLTSTMDVPVKERAFELGATDYVTKPFDAVELRSRVRAALRTKHYHDLLAANAQLDGLTGLWNRAFFDERLEEELSAARRHGRPLGLVMADIDHFKQLNDSYGHPFGDGVLRQVAQSFHRQLRTSDVLCRYGGEEFVVILREATAEGARLVAERLRSSLTSLQWPVTDGPTYVTASFGAAGIDRPADEEPAASFIARADDALYRAKQSGRDRVCAASDGTSEAELDPVQPRHDR